ncbi:hypothetical protein BD408DRAFT_431592 [Parasitella parasitica]|nr:hypothetical protein BD408DRAFT_431592 [Parasitella parasitica]
MRYRKSLTAQDKLAVSGQKFPAKNFHSFAFGNNAKDAFESIIFVFVTVSKVFFMAILKSANAGRHSAFIRLWRSFYFEHIPKISKILARLKITYAKPRRKDTDCDNEEIDDTDFKYNDPKLNKWNKMYNSTSKYQNYTGSVVSMSHLNFLIKMQLM